MTSEEWLAFLRQDFARGFPAHCGIEVTHVAHGIFETHLEVRPEHQQQDGFVHAGVMATMADHTAGYAAFTIVPPDKRVLTVEFKINFLKPAAGRRLVCRGRVVNGGRRIIVAEADVFSITDGNEKHVARAMVTLMVVEARDLQPAR